MLEYIMGTDIKEGPKTSEITGLNFRTFNDDIITQYGTTTPGKYMFRRVNSYKFITDNFFLLELEFLIQQILQSKNIWSRRRDIYDLQTKLRTKTWIKDTINLQLGTVDEAKLKRVFKMKAFPTQLEFLKHYPVIKKSHHLKGLLLDAAPGSGKTLLSLMWGVLNGNAKHIIICPSATLADAWLKHINEKAFNVAPKVWTTRDGKIPTPDADYYVFHNEFTRTDEFFGYLSMIFKYANGKGVDLVVDECHNFNELNSKQTQNLIEAVDKFPFNDALPMSGTPLKQMAREAYTVFAMIDNFFVGAARERFTKSYGLSRDKLNALLARRIGRLKYTIDTLVGLEHKEPDVISIPVSFPGAEQYTLKNIGNRMTEFIQERIKFYELHMPEFVQFYNHVVDDYELSIKDNMAAMSELLRYKQIVNKFRKQGFSSFTDNEDSKFAKKVEAKIESGLRGEALKQFRNVKSAVKYVGLKIRGEALGLVLSRARMEAIRDTIAHAGLPKLIDDAEKKTIIFTSYVSALEECEQQLRAVGFKPVTIYGENNKDRDASLKLLRDDPTVNPAITTFDSLREGVDGTMANQEIFLNAPWRDYEMKQAKARIYRQGQDVSVKFWMINLDTGKEPNITSRSVDIMEWSKEQTEILLGRSSILNAEMRTIMGAEDYGIIDEELTRPLIRSSAGVLGLF